MWVGADILGNGVGLVNLLVHSWFMSASLSRAVGVITLISDRYGLIVRFS